LATGDILFSILAADKEVFRANMAEFGVRAYNPPPLVLIDIGATILRSEIQRIFKYPEK